MASPSRRNFFIRLFGLLAIASLFASYLMFVQVSAGDQGVRISRESPRKDNNMAVRRAPEKSSDRKSRQKTILETQELKQSASIRLRGNLPGENSREHTSLRENSEGTDDVARFRHAKKLKLSILKDVFRDKRSRRTGDSYTNAQTDGEKYEDDFRDNARMRGTFTDSATTTSTPGSSFNAESSIIVDSIRGNSQSQRVVNRPVESRSEDAVRDTKKPVGPSSLDDLSRSTSSRRIANERMVDKTVVEDVKKPSPTLGGDSTVNGESFKNTDITRTAMNKEILTRSTTAMANVKEPDPTGHGNSQVVRDTYRQGIRAHTTFKKHLEPTSKTTIEDAKNFRPTSRFNTARVTALKQQKFEYVRDVVTPGVTSSRRNLIIVAQPRTGSSFLGDAFNQHPDVFYLFEPLHGVVNTPLQHLTDRRPLQFLAGMLNCKFTSITYVKQIEKFRRFSSNALSSPPMCARKTFVETPRKKCDPLSTRNMENVCKMNYSITVMKILTSRIPYGKIDSLFPLCNSSNCTVIYLVRDPRPVVFSHMKVGIQSWQHFDIRANDNAPRPSIKMYSTLVCRQIEANVKIFQNLTGSMKTRYHMLRYEDLSRNPTETLQRLYKMAGLKMVNSTLEWIKVNTGEGRSTVRSMKDYNFSTKRNSKAALDKWRLEIDPCVVSIIEDSCRSVLKLLGYKPLNGSEQLQYNLNVSLSDGQ